MLAMPTSVSAQWVVYDPTNYAQAVLTVTAARAAVPAAAPADAAAARRPRGALPRADAAVAVARRRSRPTPQPLLDALNEGDPTGAQYAQTVDPLGSACRPSSPDSRGASGRGWGPATPPSNSPTASPAPPSHQAGALRMQGENVAAHDPGPWRTTPSRPTAVPYAGRAPQQDQRDDRARSAHRGADQPVGPARAVEQLLVANKRQRDAEAKLMNAQLYQWRYGPGLRRRTCSARPPQRLDTLAAAVASRTSRGGSAAMPPSRLRPDRHRAAGHHEPAASRTSRSSSASGSGCSCPSRRSS